MWASGQIYLSKSDRINCATHFQKVIFTSVIYSCNNTDRCKAKANPFFFFPAYLLLQATVHKVLVTKGLWGAINNHLWYLTAVKCEACPTGKYGTSKRSLLISSHFPSSFQSCKAIYFLVLIQIEFLNKTI